MLTQLGMLKLASNLRKEEKGMADPSLESPDGTTLLLEGKQVLGFVWGAVRGQRSLSGQGSDSVAKLVALSCQVSVPAKQRPGSQQR